MTTPKHDLLCQLTNGPCNCDDSDEEPKPPKEIEINLPDDDSTYRVYLLDGWAHVERWTGPGGCWEQINTFEYRGQNLPGDTPLDLEIQMALIDLEG